MSEQQLKTFLEQVKSDAGLQEQLKTASGYDSVVAIAKEAGFCIDVDYIKENQSEISDEELEVVSGGGRTMCFFASFVNIPL